MIKKECKQCEREFEVYQCRNNALFCSNNCRFKNMKGQKAWNKGIPMKEEVKDRISKLTKGRTRPKFSEEWKRKMSEARKKIVGWNHSEETKNKISESHKGKKKPWLSEYNHNRTDEEIKRISNINSKKMKENWKNPKLREKYVKTILKGLMVRPTSLEKEMIDLIKKHHLPYKYVGDGEVIIGFKNPDFVNVNGEKICLEVANIFHHQGDYEVERKEHFAKYGWKCEVFMGDKLDKELVLKTLNGGN